MTSPSSDPRTLSVACFSGLGDRLRVLISGLTLAEASGRRFKCYWPRTRASAALFSELFESDLEVADEEPADMRSWTVCGGWMNPPVPNLLQSTVVQLQISTSSMLLQPLIYPEQAAYTLRCAAILSGLQPVTEVRARVEAFRAANFRPAMIGVHLRRGDFLRAMPTSAGNTAQALEAVASQLENLPDAGILLCSDDGAPDPWSDQRQLEGVYAKFQQRFSERVVRTTPRSLDRSQPQAVQDALVDLLLLRQTQAFVGTAGSSFSEMAGFGRHVPKMLCRAESAAAVGASRLDQWAQPVIRWIYKRDIPARILYYHYTEHPRWWLRGQLQRRWPGLYRWIRTRRALR